MDFHFSEEMESVRELAREILLAEAPIERVKAAEATPHWMDEALWAQLAESSLLGIAIPEEQGGMGMGFCELCVLLEELGRVVVPQAAFATLVLGALPLATFGTPAQQDAWLPPVAQGQVLLSAALVDAGAQSPASPAARARKAGDEIVLEGVKRQVPCAARAARILVPASEEGGAVGVYLVDPQAAGVEISSHVTSTGEPLSDLTLAGVRVRESDRLGGSDADGAAIAAWLFDRALVAVAATQVGVSERALRITANYVSEREQFGAPIGTFQAVQHRCADAFIDLAAMRWTLWRAAWRLAQGLPASRDAAVAKFWAAEAGSRIAGAAVHLHGGLGSDVDYPIHRYFLWSKSLELMLGGAGATLSRLGLDMARTGPQEVA